jgi:hypothetical protein
MTIRDVSPAEFTAMEWKSYEKAMRKRGLDAEFDRICKQYAVQKADAEKAQALYRYTRRTGGSTSASGAEACKDGRRTRTKPNDVWAKIETEVAATNKGPISPSRPPCGIST